MPWEDGEFISNDCYGCGCYYCKYKDDSYQCGNCMNCYRSSRYKNSKCNV